MTDDLSLVSVVTPFYNSARDLPRCIESVLAQDYPRLEYVLVDNQSDDGSSEIARSHAARDDRIRLIRTDRFLSQVENYNFALAQISTDSRWCKMCQADDWLYPRCLTEMVAVGETSPSVGLVSSYSWRGEEIMCLGLSHHETVLSGPDVCRRHLLEPIFLFGSPTTVLYRSDLVRGRRPFYELGRLHEDTEVCFEVLGESDFGFVHQVLSYRTVDARSITGSRNDLLARELDRLIVVNRYGPRYLGQHDFDRCREQALDSYYRRLAQRFLRGVVTRTNAGLFEYQRQGMSSVGLSMSVRQLCVGVVNVLVESALCPREAIGLVRRQRDRPRPVTQPAGGPA